MTYEFGQIVYLTHPDYFGKKAVVLASDETDEVSIFEEKGEFDIMLSKYLSLTPPKKKVKKTVYVGIGNKIVRESGDAFYMTSSARTSPFCDYYQHGIHAIEIECDE